MRGWCAGRREPRLAAGAARARLEALTAQALELARVLRLFRKGAMLLDEVALILHPFYRGIGGPTAEDDSGRLGERNGDDCVEYWRWHLRCGCVRDPPGD